MLRAAGFVVVTAMGGVLLGSGQLSDQPYSELFGPTPKSELVAPVPIHVYEYGFEPSAAVVKVGQVVVWKNVGKQLHIVTPSTRAGIRIWHDAEARGSARHIFNRVGVYPYYCSIHPWMRGRIVVRRTLPPPRTVSSG